MKHSELMISEAVAVARFAHTGKWIAKRLPLAVVELGQAERKRHKGGERCFGCEMQTFNVGFEGKGWLIE